MIERRGAPSARERWAAALLLLFVALATRVAVFGDPVIHIDEQFYLLVGDRMQQGALPYIDIWDRKPLGLFLLYDAIRLLSGEGVYQYQIVAMLAAAATAFLIYRIARAVASHQGALVAGIAYLLYLLTFNGVGGQSSVFYNLLVAIAALWTMRAVAGGLEGRRLAVTGVAIMLLIGLAIQIKYTVVFEGMFFGLSLMWRHWRDRRSVPALAMLSLLWVICALLPTMLALGYYQRLGQGMAFIQANFLSIFDREEVLADSLKRLAGTMALLIPFGLAIAGGKSAVPADGPSRAALHFLRLWAAVAVAGFLLFGSYYDHYAIPLLLPLAVLAAPALGRVGKRGTVYRAILLLVGVVSGGIMVANHVRQEGTGTQLTVLTNLVRPQLRGGCLYVYEGPPMLYKTTGACLATRYIFPSHLNNRKEHRALGVRSEDALRGVLARKPSVIVMAEQARPKNSNLVTRTMLLRALDADYELFGRAPMGKRQLLAYRRRAV